MRTVKFRPLKRDVHAITCFSENQILQNVLTKNSWESQVVSLECRVSTGWSIRTDPLIRTMRVQKTSGHTAGISHAALKTQVDPSKFRVGRFAALKMFVPTQSPSLGAGTQRILAWTVGAPLLNAHRKRNAPYRDLDGAFPHLLIFSVLKRQSDK